LTASDLSESLSRNLQRTYFALGHASPGSAIRSDGGFEACIGSFEHPICNFAAKLSLDSWSANRMVELAMEHRYFNVYTMPGDQPASRDVRLEILSRAGFERNYSLQQLFWEPRLVPKQREDLEPATTEPGRREVADFMANMFFSRHSPAFRRRVSEATALAEDLDLYSFHQREELSACLMVVEDPTVLGLFNLCVKPSNQDRGIGKAMVASVQRMAYEKGKFVGLQCDPTLTSWYERQGFESCGFIDVFSLRGERPVL
jgi:hypothetical protein